MVSHVDVSKLSSSAALVLLSDKDKRLPDGTVVESGLAFRNTFHLHPLCVGDFFIPCGGRPNAVNENNVDQFVFRADGSLRFKYVVEGANLFFTQAARLRLEEAGVVVFKDASANKGGVTSSSLEVMAALVLNDDEFKAHMAVPAAADGEKSKAKEPPAAYQTYCKEVQSIIDDNAALEFECLWKEHKASGQPLSVLSDLISTKITELSARIEDNDALWANEALRSTVLSGAVPTTLAKLVGSADKVLKRLPDNYKRALFGSRLASRFIYSSGLSTPEFAFFEYVSKSMGSPLASAGAGAGAGAGGH
jgi:glutamate dehydrogenase